MPLPDFLRPSLLSFPKYGRGRILAGISMGLAFALAIYSFAYVMREGCRVMSVTEENDLWVFTTEEVDFYNLFFAFVAVILGQSLCFNYWFDRPARMFRRTRSRRQSIVNDQRVLNWYFLSWFSKLAFAFVIFFGWTFPGGYHTINFYEDYRFLFVLIVLVLFLQSWNTLRLRFKGKSTRPLLLSVLVTASLSFALSKVHVVDHEAVNRSMLRHSVRYNYQLELPPFFEGGEEAAFSYDHWVYIVFEKEDTSYSHPLVVFENEPLNVLYLSDSIRKIDESDLIWIGDRTIPPKVRLSIHKKAPMGFVNSVRKELAQARVQNIAYSVVPPGAEYDQAYYFNLLWPHNILFLNRLPDIPPPPAVDPAIFTDTIPLKLKNDGVYLEGNRLAQNDLNQALKNVIRENGKTLFDLYIQESLHFEQYLGLWSAMERATQELKAQYALLTFGKLPGQLTWQQQNELQAKYLYSIRETQQKMKEPHHR